jgi:large-conductance mechanosensitive channel
MRVFLDNLWKFIALGLAVVITVSLTNTAATNRAAIRESEQRSEENRQMIEENRRMLQQLTEALHHNHPETTQPVAK